MSAQLPYGFTYMKRGYAKPLGSWFATPEARDTAFKEKKAEQGTYGFSKKDKK